MLELVSEFYILLLTGKDVRIGVRILHLITNKYTCVNKYIIDCNNYNNHNIKLSFCISTSN